MSPAQLAERIPAPHPSSINTGLSPARPATLRALLGEPRRSYSQQCQAITNPRIASRIVTANVGPFYVTGLDVAVSSLKRVFVRVRESRPDVYAAVGSAGMLCARLVRGSVSTPSSHSWGTAIDLTFGGELDIVGDGRVQRGLLAVYGAFHAEGWYWAAEFSREDGMHFEVADETLRRLLT
jgi:hypothetical protein